MVKKKAFRTLKKALELSFTFKITAVYCIRRRKEKNQFKKIKKGEMFLHFSPPYDFRGQDLSNIRKKYRAF
jgi:hypothetical protein